MVFLGRAAGAIYDIDTKGPTATLTSTIAQSPIKYKASFDSKASRFRGPAEVFDFFYDTDKGNCAARETPPFECLHAVACVWGVAQAAKRR